MLPVEEWLHLAKRAPLNGSGRHLHLRERRPNLVVKNLPDRYTAYCMACKQGAVHMKEYVRVTGVAPPVLSQSLTLPSDMVLVANAEQAVQDGVLGFLAHKNMDMVYFDCPVMFSRQRMRLMLNMTGWLGRDTTERSPQKWLTFDGQTFLHSAESKHPLAVVVEDPFSFFKVRWAMRGLPVSVYSSLGTVVRDNLMLRLLEHDGVLFFYDGDQAGYDGANVESRRLRTFGIESQPRVAPWGMDPKDMTIEAIQLHIGVQHG